MEIKNINKSFSDSYKAAGVDVTAGYEAVSLMKEHVERTMTSEVLTSIGGFGGLVLPDLSGMEEPVLVSGTDGVGTKLKVAVMMDKHDSVGIDCVAMCVNDIVCSGARPMFFLDYIALGKNVPEKVAQIVSGVAEGCVKSGCALIGGETAEMPGFYPENEYDLAGFAVGLVDRKKIIDGHEIEHGDRLIGLASNGLHSNGYSLVRRIFDIENADLNEYIPELACTLGAELLKPTRIYAKTVICITQTLGHKIKGMAHITGGGMIENVPRMLPEGIKAVITPSCIPTSPIFTMIYERARFP
jgi:phosphoribosylformylglycinamidine cyclo-ligase